MFNRPKGEQSPKGHKIPKIMNYREPLTKNEIREHAAHYENSNPAVYCGTYAKYISFLFYILDISTVYV